ncbi:MAG: hypothetical protein WB624_27590, partial [Xanthobacteraceae bacterium]
MTITTTFTASDFNSLNTAIKDIDADAATNTSYTIKVTAGISLGVLEAINLDSGSSVTIEGMNSGGTSAQVETINGQDLERGFFVYSGSVTLENLTLTNMTAGEFNGGGGGFAGGGGGAGLGGGLFIASGGSATLVGVQFSSDSAIGGNGGSASGSGFFGGGGGLGGAGGDASSGAGNGGGG